MSDLICTFCWVGLRGSSNAQFIIARQSQDYTHLIEEISALKSVLSQLKYETNKNISRLSSSAYMAFSRLSTSVYTASFRECPRTLTLSLHALVSYPHHCIQPLPERLGTLTLSLHVLAGYPHHCIQPLPKHPGTLTLSLHVLDGYPHHWLEPLSKQIGTPIVSRLSASFSQCISC